MKRFLTLWLLLIALSWHLIPAQAARTFVDGAYLEHTTAVISGWPVTICTWVRQTNTSDSKLFIGVGTSGSDNHRLNLQVDTGLFRLTTRATDVDNTDIFTAVPSLQWILLCGVWRSNVSRTAFLNGSGTQLTTTTQSDPNFGGMNRTWIGRGTGGTGNLEMNGELAIGMIWGGTDGALSDREIDALATGIHPRKIRPHALISCPHIRGLQSPEPDECGPRSYTLVSSPAAAATLGPPVGLFSMTFGR
jgi:hypothetical protein